MPYILDEAYVDVRVKNIKRFLNIQNVDGIASVLIKGKRNLNRSVDGDQVVIFNHELETKKKLSGYLSLNLMASTSKNKIENENFKVVGIKNKNWQKSTGIIINNKVQFQNNRLPNAFIQSCKEQELKNQLVVVQLCDWPINSKLPIAHITSILGPVDEAKWTMDGILLNHNIATYPFSETMEKELPSSNWTPKTNLLPNSLNRKDLTELDIVSIDPPGCTDIDDALHARLISKEELEVGIRNFYNND